MNTYGNQHTAQIMAIRSLQYDFELRQILTLIQERADMGRFYLIGEKGSLSAKALRALRILGYEIERLKNGDALIRWDKGVIDFDESTGDRY